MDLGFRIDAGNRFRPPFLPIPIIAVNAVETLSGEDVLVLTSTLGSAVQVLKIDGFAKSDTFQKFMADSTFQDLARAKSSGDRGWVSLVKEMNWLVQFAGATSAVWFYPETRGSITALRIPEAVTQTVLTKIIQRQIEVLHHVVFDLSQGRTEAGFDKLDNFGAIQELEDKSERLAAIAHTHLAACKEGKPSLIVAPTHAECQAIADAVREKEKRKGRYAWLRRITGSRDWVN